MTNYIITKYSENLKEYCLESVCGTNKEHAEKVLKRYQTENPNEKYQIDTVEEKDAWWDQGYLD